MPIEAKAAVLIVVGVVSTIAIGLGADTILGPGAGPLSMGIIGLILCAAVWKTKPTKGEPQ